MIDQIERHDIVNSLLLAGVLLVFGYGIITGVGMLGETLDEGLVEATKRPDPADNPVVAIDSNAKDEGSSTSIDDGLRPLNEIIIRVANATTTGGIAQRTTDILQADGYVTLPPRTGDSLEEESLIWYLDGFGGEADRLATEMGVSQANVSAIPDDPGIEVDEAQLVLILGADEASLLNG